MKEKRIKIRRTWDRKPETQVKQSDKVYNRNKMKEELSEIMEENEEDYIV
jgi:hypothetical protein